MGGISSDAGNAREQARRSNGEFGEQSKADPGNVVLIHRHPADILDDPRVIAALGGATLDDDEKRGLRMLLDPANDPYESCTSLDDVLAEFENRSGADIDEDMAVGRWLQEAYSHTEEGHGGFSFELVRDSGGSASSFNVLRSIPNRPGMYQAMSGDVTDLSTEPGLAGAARTAGALICYHDEIKAEMDRIYPAPGCQHPDRLVKGGRLVCLVCGSLTD